MRVVRRVLRRRGLNHNPRDYPKGTGDPGEKRSMVHVRVRAHLELASLALAQSAPSLRRRAPAPPALPRPTGYWGWPSGQVPPSGRQRLRGEGGWRSSMFWPESMTLAKESFGLDWWDDPFLQARSCQQLWAHVTELTSMHKPRCRFTVLGCEACGWTPSITHA